MPAQLRPLLPWRGLAIFVALLLIVLTALAQPSNTPKPIEKPIESENKEAPKRSDVNMLGKTDSASGESRRNENVQFNLIDNNSLKESNLRLGTTATIVREFKVDRTYFGAEFGTAPKVDLTLPPAVRAGFHGTLRWTHQNSVFSARSFFQVGSVKPARENDYGFNVGLNLSPKTKFFLDAGQTKIRGIVNGNVLVPRPDERVPLSDDPATRVIVQKFLSAYPAVLPNRTDINPRALNTNAPQNINNQQANFRVDQTLSSRNSLALQYQYTNQNVQAFQLVAGQNPNTDTKSHVARIALTRQWNANTVANFQASYDRATSVLTPEKNAVGPFVLVAGLTFLGPDGSIPIDRAQNQIRYAAQFRSTFGSHNLTYGAGVLRRQLNSSEVDAHRGFFSFSNDFGRDAVKNLQFGTASTHLITVGSTQRGFRSWDFQTYIGDSWQVAKRLNLQLGLRYQPSTHPVEVDNLDKLPYDNDLNNVAPSVGIAYNFPKGFGVLRAAGSVHFGEIYTPTFQQIRFSPPLNIKITVNAPNLVNPLAGLSSAQLRPNLYSLAPELATPYAYQYNLSWEPELSKALSKFAKLQFGYVGSRSHKLFVMWYLNRARPVPGIPQITATINQRRPNQSYSDIRIVVNGSNGYFDAGRASLVITNWHGITSDVSYWFSKAIDLGSNYLNTAHETDSRNSRSQSEFENHRDMKGLSLFDQTHAFLWRLNYATPSITRAARLNKVIGKWNFSTIVLVKTGIPFNVITGTDAPGFGNVDGNGNDRPNLLDPSILGRTIANPDTSRQLLPRSAFSYIAPTDLRGSLGRNVFRKGPIHNVNATLSKTWAILKDVQITFRAEAINAFNTPQFAEPGFELANANFGAITNTLNDGRTFRFGLQIGW